MVFAARNVLSGLAIVGAGALLALASREAAAPDRAEELESCLPVREEASAAPAPDEVSAEPAGPSAARPAPLDAAQRALAAHLSRRFYVAREATERVVRTAYRAGREMGLDPLLILAVISIESSFNPIAESVAGAKGLMQIIPRYHLEKLREHGGEQAVLDPESNILVGTRILREYLGRAGTLEAALQYYNGAASDTTARYARKVIAERSRLDEVWRTARSARES